MIERRRRQSLAIEHEGDDGERLRTVRDGEGEHQKALAEADLALPPLQPPQAKSRRHQRLLRRSHRARRFREGRLLRKSGGMRQQAGGDDEASFVERGQVERQLRSEDVGAEGKRTADAAQKLRLHRRQRRTLARQSRKRPRRKPTLHAPPTSRSESPGTAFRWASEKPPASA